jgi:hypothetical protein
VEHLQSHHHKPNTSLHPSPLSTAPAVKKTILGREKYSILFKTFITIIHHQTLGTHMPNNGSKFKEHILKNITPHENKEISVLTIKKARTCLRNSML